MRLKREVELPPSSSRCGRGAWAWRGIRLFGLQRFLIDGAGVFEFHYHRRLHRIPVSVKSNYAGNADKILCVCESAADVRSFS